MGRTMYNIKEHKLMSVIVLNLRTPLIDQNMCVGTLAQDNLR